MLERDEYSQQDMDYAFALEKKEKQVFSDDFLSDGKTSAAVYQSLFLEKIFEGMKERAENFINEQHISENGNLDALQDWLDTNMSENIKDKRMEMFKIVRALDKASNYPSRGELLGRALELIKNRWIARLFAGAAQANQNEALINTSENGHAGDGPDRLLRDAYDGIAEDGKMHRPFNNVGSFETSSLIDRTSDTVITAGTNGMLYLHALNSDFDYQAGVYKTAATTVVLRTKTKGEKDALTAVESSIAAYDKYVYYADMSGVLRCVDTDTLKTVWAVKTGDAVKAAVALDMPMSRELNLYTANMLENRKTGKVQIRRYDALSGLEAWTTEIGTAKEKNSSAEVGAKASPVIGQNSLRDLVYFTVTGLSGGPKAALIALRKEDGSVAWAYGLGDRSESSPVAVYSSEGEGWLIQCDQGGTITLLEGLTGKVIDTLKLEGQIEASPAVYNDMMVISTTGKGDTYIYGIKIRSGNEDLAVPEDAAKETPNPGKAEEEPAEEAPAEEEPAEEYDEEPAEEYDEEPGEDAEGIG